VKNYFVQLDENDDQAVTECAFPDLSSPHWENVEQLAFTSNNASYALCATPRQTVFLRVSARDVHAVTLKWLRKLFVMTARAEDSEECIEDVEPSSVQALLSDDDLVLSPEDGAYIIGAVTGRDVKDVHILWSDGNEHIKEIESVHSERDFGNVSTSDKPRRLESEHRQMIQHWEKVARESDLTESGMMVPLLTNELSSEHAPRVGQNVIRLKDNLQRRTLELSKCIHELYQTFVVNYVASGCELTRCRFSGQGRRVGWRNRAVKCKAVRSYQALSRDEVAD
jgi:hypothetical protein